jgi:hypothetical protein
MKISNVKGLANHSGTESCGGAPKCDGETLTGESAVWILSDEIELDRADPVAERGKVTTNVPFGKARRYPARSKNPSMQGSNLLEIRAILPPKPARLGCIEKSKDIRRR